MELANRMIAMFDEIRDKVKAQFASMAASTMYVVGTDPEVIWNLYLNTIPEDKRQSNNCHCCRRFIQQFGSVVTLSENLELNTIWDVDVQDEEYHEAVHTLRDFVRKGDIQDLFLTDQAQAGTPQNHDIKRDVIWTHFNANVPSKCVARLDTIPTKLAQTRDSSSMLARFAGEITIEAVRSVLELIDSNALYRGTENRAAVDWFLKFLQSWKAERNTRKQARMCWKEAVETSPAFTRLRGSSIGTLLSNISEGRDLTEAVNAFERMVAPANYQRPTALVTPRMIDQAKERVQELGLLDAVLQRQQLRELSVKDALFVYRPQIKSDDAFSQLTKAVPAQSLATTNQVTLQDFVEKVLPTARGLRLLLEPQHTGNMVALVGPAPGVDASKLLHWDNGVSWSYAGGLADSVKQRVKNAGGKVDGHTRISLAWDNLDDLDLHLKCFASRPEEVDFTNKRGRQCFLDVDMNVSQPVRGAVENICFPRRPEDGSYCVEIVRYTPRGSGEDGFTVELEFDGQLQVLRSMNNATRVALTFEVKDGKLTNVRPGTGMTASSVAGSTKWGVTSGIMHQVKAVCWSPNYWGGAKGNKHLFVLLEGCVPDEPLRPFYNEMLNGELRQDRKVFELLAGKIDVAVSDQGLAGVGFSETQRNEMTVEVTGTTKQTLKVII